MDMSGRRDGRFLIGNTTLLKEAQRLAAGGRDTSSQASCPLQTRVTSKPAFAGGAHAVGAILGFLKKGYGEDVGGAVREAWTV